MDKLKETLKRAVAWAKKHPVPAALIVIVLGVVGYLIYKSTQGSSSSSSDSAVAIPDSLGLSGGTVSTGGYGGSGLDSLVGSVGTDVTSGSNGGSNGGSSGGSGGGAGGGGYANMIYQSQPDPTPAFDLSSVAPAYGMAATTQSAILPIFSPAPVTTTQSFNSSLLSNPVLGMNLPSAKAAAAKPLEKALMSSESEKGAQYKSAAQNLTDSQKVGKGKNFTGTVDGKYYLNGWLASVPAAKQYLGTPSAASVSMPTVKAAAKTITAGSKANKANIQ
jgi:hypothetical protein